MPSELVYAYPTAGPANSELPTLGACGPAAHRTRWITLIGQPWSGMAWLEAAAFSLASAACNRSRTGASCSTVVDSVHRRESKYLTLRLADCSSMRFSVEDRHTFPPAGYQTASDCSYPSSTRLSVAPCKLSVFTAPGQNASYQTPATDPGRVAQCAFRCNSTRAALSGGSQAIDQRFVMIYRDPRASARTQCSEAFPSSRRGNRTDMIRCMRRRFVLHASWLKYREVWLTMNPDLRERTTLICYEWMLRKPVEELQKLASALGVGDLPEEFLLRALASSNDALAGEPNLGGAQAGVLEAVALTLRPGQTNASSTATAHDGFAFCDDAGKKRTRVLRDATPATRARLRRQGFHPCGRMRAMAKGGGSDPATQFGSHLVSVMRRTLKRLDFQMLAPMFDIPLDAEEKVRDLMFSGATSGRRRRSAHARIRYVPRGF